MFAARITRAARVVVAAAALASFAPAGAAEMRDENVATSDPALQRPADVTHMIDAEKKGYVTREELLKFQETVLGVIDQNRDRRASEPEFTDRG